MITSTGLGRGVAVAVLTAALGVVVPVTAAHAKPPPPPVTNHMGDFPTEEQCMEEAEIKKQQNILFGYTCASNGNPAGLNSGSYSLYEHRNS